MRSTRVSACVAPVPHERLKSALREIDPPMLRASVAPRPLDAWKCASCVPDEALEDMLGAQDADGP